MYIQFYTEELSAEAALRELLPRILGSEIDFDIHVFQGKTDLLDKLPMRLHALANWMPNDWRIVVVVDRDDDDCLLLKQHLNQIAADAGLTLRNTSVTSQPFQVINRIAVEELEAWFFGDIPALRAAYPRLSDSLGERRQYRDPDAITGGTWEALERELQRMGYHKGGLQKIVLARDVARYMIPERNRSRSFQTFYSALKEIICIE
ncbi:hypothetical protein OSCT_1879 [Oscillochloris trichoides DG-6]|uniref:DUF4276 domain-containing protein n=1 Tax=Oscillochloris trichoides DG-6 TaxID=765420 RepID=E1IEX8_9CHLR|nr:DUF4276 family protein [Oscillochloris trichoides]EFO80275.1 hypothetical protein OSCT_1879 [Oscillochloris trichoides DG-6]